MRARLLSCLALIAASGCESVVGAKPDLLAGGAPAFAISDGAHGSGNPDFFFLPPMVPNPKGSANWNEGAFNGSLKPTVTICSLTVTTEAAVAGAPCAGGYLVTYNIAQPDAGSEQYSQSWVVPVSSITFYRIKVSVGSKTLGSADIETGANSSQLKNVNTGQFVPLVDGRTLPIKFRIEQYALCSTPGVGPCTSAAVPLTTGGTVQTILPGTTVASGVTIPAQTPTTGGPVAPTITVAACPDLNDRATDLPTFGSCVRVTSDPVLPPEGLTAAASVFICDVGPSVAGRVVSHNQEERITLHRLDINTDLSQRLAALPHAPGCPVATASSGSLVGMLSALRHGEIRAAGREVAALLSPRPLYAARRVDLGGGGFTLEFSDFQFALPARFEVDPSTDNQAGAPGSTLPIQPTVRVRDLGGELVSGARVRFATTDGSISPTPVVTGADGVARTTWTLRSTSGKNSLTVSGRGIAGSDVNGPREGIDPFQPIQTHFDGYNVGAPVTVLTGSVFMSATGDPAPVDIAPFGSDSYTYFQSYNDPFAGWELPTFDTTYWSVGRAPFGSAGGCTISPSVVTPRVTPTYFSFSEILLRKSFTTPYAGVVTIKLRIDNDAKVYIDGEEITSTGGPVAANSKLGLVGTESFWVHDNCATDNAPSFTHVTTAGNHLLAIRARDRGGDSFVDAAISLAPH